MHRNIMAKEYTYATIVDKYFCLQSGILSLSWILLFKYKRLHLESLGIQRRQIPGILKTLVKYRLFRQLRPTTIFTLPVFGHLCIKVHHGHKLFNLSKLSTTKFFNNELSAADAGNEIRAITEASSLDFAPTVLEVEPGNRWFSEAFIPGTRSKKTGHSNPEMLYKTTIVHHLRKMILSRPAHTVALGSYVRDLRKKLAEQLTYGHLDSELHNNVQTFIDTIAAQLESSNDIAISLAFTHGDFSFVNFVYRDNEIWVIDWEDARERSLLHDLFNYFYTEIYYERTQSTLDTAINEAIHLLMEQHDLRGLAESSKTGDNKAVYQWLFYLERIIMLLGRDASANRSRVIQRTIDIFTVHQKEMP